MSAPATTAAAWAGFDAEPNVPMDRLGLLGLRQPAPPVPTEAALTGSVGRLRAMVPRRSLGFREAEGVAERQADRLRSQLGSLSPRLREADLASLAWLTITRREHFPAAGTSTKTDYGWLIVLRGSDALVRQRFTLAHEIKHILDDSLIDLPGGLYPALGGYSARDSTERICDRFAGALLMPKALLRADWADGLQDMAKLAKRYDVSRDAMSVRLSQLGLLEPTPRCLPPDHQTLEPRPGASTHRSPRR
jgi:Zn-dependent peptidase ImmA (M78 family)